MSKQISRRSFLKGAAVGAIGAATLGVGALAEEAGIYTPGTYSATATGMGEVTVTMTFDANAITDVVVSTENETDGIGKPLGPDFAAQILAAQGAEIDVVSGASVTSGAVLTVETETVNNDYRTTLMRNGAPYKDDEGKLRIQINGVNNNDILTFTHTRICLPVQANVENSMIDPSGFVCSAAGPQTIDQAFADAVEQSAGYTLPEDKTYVLKSASIYNEETEVATGVT